MTRLSKYHLRVASGVIALAWICHCGAAEMPAPTGFKAHDFGPLGGQILVPDGWFVTEGAQGSNYLFTASKEDLAATGTYKTGFRVQWIAGISKMADAKASQAVQINIARKKSREQVVRECEPERIGPLLRQCLETRAPIDGHAGKFYRLVYTFSWSDEMDTMIGATFGAPEEEWESAQKIYEVIKDFKLVDRDRMDAKKKRAAKSAGN